MSDTDGRAEWQRRVNEEMANCQPSPNHITITHLTAENERLRAALQPFAEAASKYDPAEGDDDLPVWDWSPTTGMLRKARAALEGKR